MIHRLSLLLGALALLCMGFAQESDAARITVKTKKSSALAQSRCPPPQPCHCHCSCPEQVWIPPPPLPNVPTPSPFIAFMEMKKQEKRNLFGEVHGAKSNAEQAPPGGLPNMLPPPPGELFYLTNTLLQLLHFILVRLKSNTEKTQILIV